MSTTFTTVTQTGKGVVMIGRRATRGAAWVAATIVFAATLVASAGAAYAATERRESLEGDANGGTTRRPSAPAPGEVQLMRGFHLMYDDGAENHIRAMGVLPEADGDLAITFDDRSGDDPMSYFVFLTKVQFGMTKDPSAGVVSPPTLSRTCGGGTCTFPLQAPPTSTHVFLLRGFRFRFLPQDAGFPFPGNCTIFTGCDHHLSIVGIQPSGSNVAVTYRDKNGDDDYSVAIAYSWVPRSLIQRFTTVLGTAEHANGAHKDTSPSGVAAITGFRVGYVPVVVYGSPPTTYLPDTHISRFSYQLTSTGIFVAFGDATPSLEWQYQLNYVTFR
jgi:hypothetical protein